jgi:hypothetical protein
VHRKHSIVRSRFRRGDTNEIGLCREHQRTYTPRKALGRASGSLRGARRSCRTSFEFEFGQGQRFSPLTPPYPPPSGSVARFMPLVLAFLRISEASRPLPRRSLKIPRLAEGALHHSVAQQGAQPIVRPPLPRPVGAGPTGPRTAGLQGWGQANAAAAGGQCGCRATPPA